MTNYYPNSMLYPNTGYVNNAYVQNQPLWNQNQQFGNAQQPTQQINDGSIMAVFVHGEDAVNNYLVAYGKTVMLIDFESGKFWIKSNDNGIPQKLRKYSFSEDLQEQTVAPTGNAVTREEFDKLANSVNKLISELGGTVNE